MPGTINNGTAGSGKTAFLIPDKRNEMGTGCNTKPEKFACLLSHQIRINRQLQLDSAVKIYEEDYFLKNINHLCVRRLWP